MRIRSILAATVSLAVLLGAARAAWVWYEGLDEPDRFVADHTFAYVGGAALLIVLLIGVWTALDPKGRDRPWWW